MSIAAGNPITWADILDFYNVFNSVWRSSGAANPRYNPDWTPSGGGQGNLATAATMNNLAQQIYNARNYKVFSNTTVNNDSEWQSWIGGTYPSTSIAAGTLITAQPWQTIYNNLKTHQCSYSWNGSNRSRDHSDDMSFCSNKMK